MKNLLAKVSGEEFRAQGERAADLLRSSAYWPCYKTLFIFLSLNNEIDTTPLLEAALDDGKRVFAPRVERDAKSGPADSDGKLVFYPVLSADGPWREGPFGIREPAGLLPADAEDFPALIVTPGLAFDRDGNRLGRGGGYYDRFFAALDSAERSYTAIGFCMDFQIADKVPASPHDKTMDGVVSAAGLSGFSI